MKEVTSDLERMGKRAELDPADRAAVMNASAASAENKGNEKALYTDLFPTLDNVEALMECVYAATKSNHYDHSAEAKECHYTLRSARKELETAAFWMQRIKRSLEKDAS